MQHSAHGRHLADHRSPATSTRLSRFIRLERESGPVGSHPSSQAIATRATEKGDTSNRRVQEYLRIARGYTT